MKTSIPIAFACVLFGGIASTESAQINRQSKAVEKIAVPKTYDDAETATWHVPLAFAEVSSSFLTSSYFYARKVRPIYYSYPVYHPDREPEDYIEKTENGSAENRMERHRETPKTGVKGRLDSRR